jgi:hypothetical protein
MLHRKTISKEELEAKIRRRRISARIFGIDEQEAVRQVLAAHRVSDEQFRHWISSPQFRKKLRALRRELSARRDLEISRGAHHAAKRMRRAAVAGDFDGFTDLQRKVCVDLIKLSRHCPAKPRPPAAPDEQAEPLIHEDVAPDEARRLLDQF